MLPQGAAYLPSKCIYVHFSTRLMVLNIAVRGVGKIAKDFAIDFAEAVVRYDTLLQHPFLTMVSGWVRI